MPKAIEKNTFVLILLVTFVFGRQFFYFIFFMDNHIEKQYIFGILALFEPNNLSNSDLIYNVDIIYLLLHAIFLKIIIIIKR